MADMAKHIYPTPPRYFTRVPCSCCLGQGTQLKVDGAQLRATRQKLGISLREVADRMGLSAAFVSDVELGRRNCSPERLQQFLSAMRKNLVTVL